MFSEVKNVNVESLKNDSKLLDFGAEAYPQPLPKGKGFSISPLMPINCLINQRVKETKRQREEETKSQRD